MDRRLHSFRIVSRYWDSIYYRDSICLVCMKPFTGMWNCKKCFLYTHEMCALKTGCPLCEPEALYGP